MSKFTVRGDGNRASRALISVLLLVVLVPIFAYPLLVSPASSVSSDTRAISEMTLTGGDNNVVPGTADTQPSCNCSQEIELITGIRVSGDHVEATFRNPSSTCSHLVGIATYMKFNESVAHQELFAFEQRTLNPGETATLSASLPPCAAAADAFCGDVIQSFQGGVRYGSRILDDLHTGGPYCSRIASTNTPAPTHTPIPVNTSSPTRTPTTRPSNTPAASPTSTGIPTNTSLPNNTPLATSTPTSKGTPIVAATVPGSPGSENTPTYVPGDTPTEAPTDTPTTAPTPTSTPGIAPQTATPFTASTIVPATFIPRPDYSQTPDPTPTLSGIKSSPTSTATIVTAARATRTTLTTATAASAPVRTRIATPIPDTHTPTATSKPSSTAIGLPPSTPTNLPTGTAPVITVPTKAYTPQPSPTRVEEAQGETGGPPTPTPAPIAATPTVAPPDRPPKLGAADSLFEQILALVSLSGVAILMGIRLARKRNGGATLRM